jgi:hypothetical protein
MLEIVVDTFSENVQVRAHGDANADLVPEELNRVALAADRLKRRRAQVKADEAELYEAIRAAAETGSSVRLIARVAGISASRVHQIIQGPR